MTALALRTSTAIVRPRRELVVYSIASLMPRRERLHFAFLHIVRRMLIQKGQLPTEAESWLVANEHRPGALLEWWRSCSREFLSHLPRRADMPPNEPWPPPLHFAEDDELAIVVIALAHHVWTEDPAYPWYSDGWRESVAWARAGCPRDASDHRAAKARVEHASADRLAAMSDEQKLDAAPIGSAEAMTAMPEDLPPVSMDLEAELCGEREDGWEGF